MKKLINNSSSLEKKKLSKNDYAISIGNNSLVAILNSCDLFHISTRLTWVWLLPLFFKCFLELIWFGSWCKNLWDCKYLKHMSCQFWCIVHSIPTFLLFYVDPVLYLDLRWYSLMFELMLLTRDNLVAYTAWLNVSFVAMTERYYWSDCWK